MDFDLWINIAYLRLKMQMMYSSYGGHKLADLLIHISIYWCTNWPWNSQQHFRLLRSLDDNAGISWHLLALACWTESRWNNMPLIDHKGVPLYLTAMDFRKNMSHTKQCLICNCNAHVLILKIKWHMIVIYKWSNTF